MMLIDSLKFTQWAVAKKAFVESLVHFEIKNGTIQSYNGMISLCSPIELDLDCRPLAAPFIKAIQTCKDTVQLSLTPTGRLSVKSGNFRALIECSQQPFPEIQPEGESIACDGGIMTALKILEPLISEDSSPSRTWSRGILLSGHHAYATNNVVLAEFDLGFWFPSQLNLPHAAVNELIRIGKEPQEILVTDNSATFVYEDSRWLRTQLYSPQWPDIERVLNGQSEFVGVDIPDGFWQGLEDLKPFANEAHEVHLVPNYLTTSLDHETATYSNVNGVPKGGCYNIDMFLLIKDLAQSIEFGAYPQPCRFAGDRIRGAIVGRTTGQN